jgi:ribonuclease HI
LKSFSGHTAKFFGGFDQNIGSVAPFVADLCATMYAIEKGHEMNWKNLWIETNSKMVVSTFQKMPSVPWYHSNRWNNCL